MSRLIDADKLSKLLEKPYHIHKYDYDPIGKTVISTLDLVFNLISDMPTVDAVEVIRCKDCKYFSMTTLGMPYACWHEANKIYGETGEHAYSTVCTRVDSLEHYCSYGEREGE